MKKILIAVSLIASQSALAIGIASGAANSGTNYPMVQDIVKWCCKFWYQLSNGSGYC